MYEDIKSLSVAYPLIDVYEDDTLKQIADNIVDAKIQLVVTTAYPKHSSSVLELILRSMDSDYAYVTAYLLEYGVYEIEVPLHSIYDNTLPTTSSYILVKEKPSVELNNINCKIHQDCLTVLQEAPFVYVNTNKCKWDDEFPGDPEHVIEEHTLLPLKNINIVGAHNVSVTGYDSNISINAYEGAGLSGKFDDNPLGRSVKEDALETKGVASINGISGGITITANSEYFDIEPEYITNSADYVKILVGVTHPKDLLSGVNHDMDSLLPSIMLILHIVPKKTNKKDESDANQKEQQDSQQ